MIFIPREGRAALNWSLWQCDYRSAKAQMPQVHLYGADIGFALGMTLADLLLIESAWGGYAPLPLKTPVDAGEDLAGDDLTTFAETLWTADGSGLPAMIYGYWVDLLCAGLTRRLAWIERFPAPVLMADAGDAVAITPQFALGALGPCNLVVGGLVGGVVLGGVAE